MAKQKELELAIKIAGKMDKSLTATLTGARNQISSFSRSLGALGTAGLAAMSSLAAGSVVKVVDGMADETGKISDKLAANGKTYAQNYETMVDSLKDLSTQIPYTFEDLTRLAAAAGQSGKSFEDLTQTDFLKDVAMWGTAMDISADQAGNWAAKWEQSFNMNHDQVMEIADVINYLGNNYATTAAEIAESVNEAASMGQITGVDPKATAAIAASMQAMGVSADVTGTTVKRIYTNINKGSMATAKQQQAFARLGMTAEGVAKAMQVDGTGTLLNIFEAIGKLPGEQKLSTLNALFGQWAIEGGAKVTQNLDLLKEMLAAVNDPSAWTGSMEHEFIIKATTPEAISTMLGSAVQALKADVGEAFLPAYKALGTSLIDFIQNIRANPEQLDKLAESLGTLASKGVERLGNALNNALPYIQSGLDYLVNHGDQVVKVIGGLAAASAAMHFAPAAEGLIRGAGGVLFGSGAGGGGPGEGGRRGGIWGGLKSLFTGGQRTAVAGAGLAGSFRGAAGSNGLRATLGATISSLISGNGIAGTAGLLSAAAGTQPTGPVDGRRLRRSERPGDGHREHKGRRSRHRMVEPDDHAAAAESGGRGRGGHHPGKRHAAGPVRYAGAGRRGRDRSGRTDRRLRRGKDRRRRRGPVEQHLGTNRRGLWKPAVRRTAHCGRDLVHHRGGQHSGGQPGRHSEHRGQRVRRYGACGL